MSLAGLGVDVDGDGAVDIVASSADASRVGWWENVNGDASHWVYRVIASDLRRVVSVTAADFDGDGDPDVATGSRLDNTVIWCENLNGQGTSWVTHPVASEFASPGGFSTGDLDGNGTADLIGCAYAGGSVSAWLNVMGDATSWEEVTLGTGFNGPQATDPGDLDGDEDMDVVLTDWLGGDLHWLENTAGDGRHWAAHEILLNFGTAAGVTAVDLDGDGDLDVLSGGIHFVLPQRNRVAWFENVHGDGRQWV
ncbi:MAG: VCBS repeat-containing protein, partial [Actinobacteria bacterium ATB1]|nr:VCBS repeat-containing protein [Actinobacteria bacterium ATB1]